MWPWALLVALLVLNWLIASGILGPASRTRVSYMFIARQVDVGNVRTIISTAETIEGEFKNLVTCSGPDATATGITRFTTERPSSPTTTCSRNCSRTALSSTPTHRIT